MAQRVVSCVSDPLKRVLMKNAHQDDDLIHFYDDSWAGYKKRRRLVVGSGHVPLWYFTENPRPDGRLEDSMYVEVVGSGDHAGMVRTLADMIVYNQTRHKNTLAHVVCAVFRDEEVVAALGTKGYGTDSLSPIVRAYKRPSLLNVTGAEMASQTPRDYLYKQKVGDYAKSIVSHDIRKRR